MRTREAVAVLKAEIARKGPLKTPGLRFGLVYELDGRKQRTAWKAQDRHTWVTLVQDKGKWKLAEN